MDNFVLYHKIYLNNIYREKTFFKEENNNNKLNP